ncbi:unnamed protein product [Spirodela intermedia]|uniref:Uncharacterized protein n=1 Tax=Spirodela intermedia TaxID=51605 RepID=A0A7I8KJN8_SPIIN|nr:unnamed protein product [Spirodela intermedia]
MTSSTTAPKPKTSDSRVALPVWKHSGAMPKSPSRALNSASSSTLLAFRSRCTTFWSYSLWR